MALETFKDSIMQIKKGYIKNQKVFKAKRTWSLMKVVSQDIMYPYLVHSVLNFVSGTVNTSIYNNCYGYGIL